MVKEAAYYKKEAGENEARVQKMKDDGVDQWTVKKAEEVLGESYMMIPESEKRMKESIEDLFAFMVRRAGWAEHLDRRLVDAGTPIRRAG